ncbi:DUF2510 domain-containing protein [Microbacterium sp.]|uniref:DUF2510 domain-containing protein n=1 Tax=Microbacterium sp. TaxID=51671 RepID=UPI0028ABE142|nr:DUF2510 domain-containing protein [Microbacterium sp.]
MSVPAGWYDDGSGRQRWWDGEQWTEHYAPESAAEPAEQTADTGAVPEAGASGDPHGEYTPPVAPGAGDTAQPTEVYPSVTPEGYPQSGYGEAPYGQAPYGQAAYGRPDYGQQGYPGTANVDPQNPYAAPAPYGGAPAYAGAYPASDAGPRKTPVLGYVGLGLAVVGGIIACIPNFVTFGIGSFLLFAAFVVSIIALFIKNTAKWPGIVGLILSIVMGIVATIVLSITLFATIADSSWESSADPYASEEPYASESPYADESAAPEESAAPDATGERPTADEVALGLEQIMVQQQDMEYPEGMLLCLGEELVASDMSDASLQQIADGDLALTDPDDAMEFGSTLTDAASTCATQ